MAQRIKHHGRLALCLLVFLAVLVHGTRDILSETCEDQHGADLNENVALNKPATQSPTSNGGVAGRLVDGNHNPYFANGSCSETEAGSSSWEVDLGAKFYVTSVTVTTRADDYWREVNMFSITVATSLCASGMFVHNGETTTYVCEKVEQGTHVRISVNGPATRLSLCEVEVHGYPFSFYENAVNYALLQPAKMSSLYQLYYASGAVDGVRNTDLYSGWCMHNHDNFGWWSVNLGILVDVYAVVITSRGDDYSQIRMYDFDVRIGKNWHPSKNPTCTSNQPLQKGETRAIFCSRPIRGNNVGMVQKMDDNFDFCEVSVHGRDVGWITGNRAPVCLSPGPLGMENNAILDSQLLASSQADPLCGVEQSRLNKPYAQGISQGAWCAKASSTDPNPWMQVGFLWPAAVTGILTQGRSVQHDQWATSFKFSSSNDFVRYESYMSAAGSTVFQGNSDRDTIVSHPLQPVRVVRIIRIHIVTHHNWPSMRVEFVGCYYKDKGFPLPRALGMQSKEISDALITSSTAYRDGLKAHYARLWGTTSWVPTSDDPNPWIQINFVLTVTILEVLTQGRDSASQWVKNYKVAFAQETNSFDFYRDENGGEKLFPGNTDSNTVIRHAFSPAIRAQYLRLYPKEYQTHRSIRIEVVGYYEDRKVGPLGLEDYRIESAQLSSSSQWNNQHTADDGRLHGPRNWASSDVDHAHWWKVDFWRLVKVTEILTQGRSLNTEYWIKSYYLYYSLDAVNFKNYAPYGTGELIKANTDGHSVSRKLLLPAIEARALRIFPHTYTWMSLRVEVIGYYITCAASCYARPLGMESREISDAQITSSSVWNGNNGMAGAARLNFNSMYGARSGWAAHSSDRSAWIQVAFHQTAIITEVQTQGRFFSQLMYNYTLSYANNGVDFETYLQDDVIKIFDGNKDAGSIVSHSLWQAIIARFIRINAVSCTTNCAVRAEFIGSYEATHGPALIDPEFVEFENTLTASSSVDWNHRAHFGIISNHFEPRAWSPLRNKGEYIQVDLLELTVISGVGLRLAGDRIHDHFTKLILWYGDTEKSLKFLRDRTGNMTLFDTNVCYTALEKPLLARYVRFSIDSWETRPDFRFQLYGTTVNSEGTAGVESGSIKDDQMKSSNHPNDPHPANEGRLNGPGAWCGNPSRNKLYLQIDFEWNFEVHGVGTQGKQVDITQYVTEFKLSSTMDGIMWNLYKEEQTVKIFPGNTNCQCIRKNLVQPFLARALRFLPIAWKETPCLRAEIYGVYKGILRIHARSGVLKGPNETVVTKKCSIKLNGREVSRKMSGYNVVVASQKTGALVSSGSADNPAGVKDLLMNIPSDSIVVVATQNVTQRPSDETLKLLEHLGAISLRYSQWSQNLLFLLLGYKGNTRVDWIKEKLGTTKDDVIRIAVPVKLNENEMKPTISEHFVSPNDTNDSVLTLSGYNAYVSRNMTGRCGEDNSDCEMGLSLSMWMKPEPLDIVENVEPAPTPERYELQYYSKGYIYTLNRDAKIWADANRYCLGIGATLPIYHDLQTRDYVVALMARIEFPTTHLGLTLNPRTMMFTEWMDGTSVTSKWNNYEPSGLPENCAVQTTSHLNDITFEDPSSRKFICQQPVEALLGDDLFSLGMENMLIPDANIEASGVHPFGTTPAHNARLNHKSWGWCTPDDASDPFIQVDLGRLTRICAVATQGRGVNLKFIQYPTSFWVDFSNDSGNWETLLHRDQKKYFRGNHDNFGVVINRFPQPEVAQIVRINIEEYVGKKLCMRMELFGCKAAGNKNENAVDPPLPPKPITANTPKTCLDVLMSGKTTSGVYMIDPEGRGAFPAFCDQETDDGGWIVLQRRFDGSVDFNRPWDEYKWGFGERYREYWLGLEYISRLTHANVMDMRVDLEKFDESRVFCVYDHFQVADETKLYTVAFGSDYGTVENSMSAAQFSTKDHGNVETAKTHKGAWWYGSTVVSNLNGQYFDSEVNGDVSIFWKSLNNKKGLKSTKLMIREGMQDPGSTLGMQNLFIRNDQLSSNCSMNNNEATNARLNGSAFWEFSSDNICYMTVKLISVRRITHISIQGGSNAKYVKAFSVRFKKVDGTVVVYEENGKKRIFEANDNETATNVNAIRSNCFNEPIETTEIQVFPETCGLEGCSLRMELYACDDPCSTPIGIQSDFPLERITNSTSASPLGNLRLRSSTAPWLADHGHKHNARYVEVNLIELFRVTAIATQGGVDDTGSGRCYVRTYYLMYVNELMKWVNYGGRKPKIVVGNTNSRSIAKTKLETPFLAHTVRLVANTYQNKVCLKLEVYGCYPDNPSFTLFTDDVKLGKRSMELKGRYRYCPKCECPGCIKSLCVRVFGQKYLIASNFAYDCTYHDFDITVEPSAVPGRHRVHLIESEYGNCNTEEHEYGSSERIVGSVNVKKEPSNCLEILLSGNTESGKYKIDPDGKGSFEVYCDQTLCGGGWTVIQTRASTDVNFDRTWLDYKVGFGELEEDFWLGNKYIHRLTAQKQELSLELKSTTGGDVTFVQYGSFQISDRDSGFRLHVAEYVSGPGGNCLEDSNGVKFTTSDRDSDENPDVNCAVQKGFGWWFRGCNTCQLNGSPASGIDADKQLKYNTWTGKERLQHAKMKVRERKTVFCNDHFCYYVLKTWNNWLEASQHCKRFHSDLVSIHSAGESDWIRSEILLELGIEKIHIGLKNGTWTDGSAFDFHNFSSDVQNDLCPVLDRAGSWQYQDCRMKSRILCKRSKWCFKGTCHIYGYDKMNFSSAKKYCRDNGYELSKMRSEDELNYLKNVNYASTEDSTWLSALLGLTLDSRRQPYWYDGKKVRYWGWKDGQPVENSRSCAQFWPLGWTVITCKDTKLANPLCEKIYREYPLDCLDLLLSGSTSSGIYTVDPDDLGPIQVYCDQETYGGGWTILLRRVSNLSFANPWEDYKSGFGNLEANFWLGNEYAHRLTKLKQEVLFDLESQGGDNGFALYKTFQVADEGEKYKVTIEGYQASDVGDAMHMYNQMKFSTKDEDNDLDPSASCAADKQAGWWFKDCSVLSCLTCRITKLTWLTWTSNQDIERVEMKIRSSSVVSCDDTFCYYLTDVKKSWSDALLQCRNFNADLVSIHSQAQMDFILQNIIASQALESVHLGLTASNSWTDGSAVTLNKLASPLADSKCSSVLLSGDWISNDCNEEKTVLCKRAKHCYKGDCYFIHETPMTGSAGEAFCEESGYQAVKVSSHDEKDYLLKLVRESTSDDSVPFVLLGHVLSSDEDRVWRDGTLLKYDDWTGIEPNGIPLGELHSMFDAASTYDVGVAQNGRPGCEKAPIIRNCNEVKRKYDRSDSGVYAYIGKNHKTFPAYCELNTKDGSWLVFQRRVKQTTLTSDFTAYSWASYKDGFGTKESNYWLGNKYIHELTWNNPHRLKIVIHTNDFHIYEAIYEDFYLGTEASGFVIHFGDYSGNAGDALSKHRGMPFSAKDDDRSVAGCTSSHQGGWWFENCLDSNLNGVFTSWSNSETTIFWRTIKDKIMKTEMKIQPYPIGSRAPKQTSTSLTLTSKQDWMEINLQTASQQWTTRVAHPDPFITHVSVTWEESSCLRYYENGTLVSEVPAINHERPGYPNSSSSVFVDLPYLWLHELKLWDKPLTTLNAYSQYAGTEITFEDQEELSKWTIKKTSNYSWEARRHCTPSYHTGPCGDHTYNRDTGTYIIAEASRLAPAPDVAIVESPIFLDHYKCLSFWYHLFGRKMGSLTVYAAMDRTLERVFLTEISGDVGNQWRSMQVKLSITGVFKIILEAKRGEYTKNDIAIDDISLSKENCRFECEPECEPGMRCDHSSLQCVHEGIYDHLWTMDTLPPTDEKNRVLTEDYSALGYSPMTGVIDKAIRYADGSSNLGSLSDKCYDEICFTKYTLSFWLLYNETTSTYQSLVSFYNRLLIDQSSTQPKNFLNVQTYVANRRCSFQVLAPAEIWNHFIFVVNEKNFTLYKNGHEVENTTLVCSLHSSGPPPTINILLGKMHSWSSTVGNDFGIDDMRLLLGILSAKETLDNYKTITGYDQTISFKAKLTTITWQQELMDDESDIFRSISRQISDEIISALGERSFIKNVHVLKFTQNSSTIVEVDIVYHNVSYYDVLLLEEAIYVNNTFDSLQVNGLEMDSYSVPKYSPKNLSAVALNDSSLSVSWSPVDPKYINGVYQGYKILYKKTNGSGYADYMFMTTYANQTEEIIIGLEHLTNYTLKVIAFSLSGDGFPSDPVHAFTFDGEVTDSPNMTVVNVSSTALYVNWTMLPLSTDEYRQLLGYKLLYWKESNESQIFNKTFSSNENHVLVEDLEKWTVYCFAIAGFTYGMPGLNYTRCARTFEDAPEHPPNVSVTQITTSSIQLEWLPPPDVPGIIRYYNISYRVLNISDSEEVEVSVLAGSTSYLIQDLTGLMLCEINVTAITVKAGPSEMIKVLTNEGVPLAAPNISLLNMSSTSFEMNWTNIPWELHNGILLGYKIWIETMDRVGLSIVPNISVQTFSPNEFYKRMINMSKWTTYCVKVAGFTVVGDGVATVECTRTYEDAPEETARNFSAIEVNVNSIKVQWDPPPITSVPGIIRSYNITYRNLNYTNENLSTTEVGSSEDSVLLEQLHGLTLYEINVTAITILPGPWEVLYVLTQEGVPVAPPPSVVWYNLSSTSLNTTWEPLPAHLCNGIVVGYNVFFWKHSEPQNISNVTVSEKVALLEDLEKWTIYCGQVEAFTKIGVGPRSQVECIRTFEDEPEVAPTGLNGTNTTWTSFYLSWESIDPGFIPGILRNYRVSYEIQDPGFNQAYDGDVLVGTRSTSFNLTDLIGLTNYKITVSGVTVKDGPGVEVYLKTNEGVPTSPPEEIVPVDVTSTTITVSWKEIFLPERHGIIRGYRVTYKKLERRNKREAEAKTLTFGADIHTAFMFKLDPYTNYTITVAGYTSVGLGVEKHFIIETKQGAPGVAPKNTYGVNFTGPTSIHIGWGSLTRAELQGVLAGYEVRYREFSVADEIIRDPPPEKTKLIYTDVNSARLTGLETYTTYQVRVAAVSGGGRGTFSGTLYLATCRCHKTLTTNYWNFEPYTNISRQNPGGGLFPYLLNMVTLYCCQNCLEHGTSEIDYFQDGFGANPERYSDINVKRNLALETDFSFPIYGYNGQSTYMRYFGYAPIVDIIGTVFFTLEPEYSLIQGKILMASVLSIVPFLAIAILFAYIAGVLMWALEHGHNEDEFTSSFFKGAANGFWWAYITMTTVGYGDKTARTVTGRLFAVVWVLTGLCICSLLIGTIATAFTTSTTPPDPDDIIIYGSRVAALQDSPDHKLGLRRNAKVNPDNKTYQKLQELQKVLLSGAVDGILVDAYVSDARKDLFSQFKITKIIDLSASYGVVMGTDAKKLRKCFNKFWRENAAARSNFIENNTSPAKILEVPPGEIMKETYNPQSALYQIALTSCTLALLVLFLCGCIYEIIRRKKKSLKVDCEKETSAKCINFRQQATLLSESVKKNIAKLRRKQINELIAFSKKQQDNNVGQTA